MNADDFPFEEILAKSNSEEELIDNIRSNCSDDDFKQIIKIYAGIGEISQERCDELVNTRKLKARWSVEAAQDLMAIHDIDIAGTIAENVIEEMESK